MASRRPWLASRCFLQPAVPRRLGGGLGSHLRARARSDGTERDHWTVVRCARQDDDDGLSSQPRSGLARCPGPAFSGAATPSASPEVSSSCMVLCTRRASPPKRPFLPCPPRLTSPTPGVCAGRLAPPWSRAPPSWLPI